MMTNVYHSSPDFRLNVDCPPTPDTGPPPPPANELMKPLGGPLRVDVPSLPSFVIPLVRTLDASKEEKNELININIVHDGITSS